jgi:hypothetical protein
MSGFAIVVFSTDRSTWTARSLRVSPPIQVSSDGTFKTSGLPPGEYLLAALIDYEPGDLGDSTFLEQVAAAAIKITQRAVGGALRCTKLNRSDGTRHRRRRPRPEMLDRTLS